jgi:pimeloyl-ACP methyl ester carboxylesterase
LAAITTNGNNPRPVALVHGFASSFEHNWRRTGWVDILADAGRSVVEIDMLGHGTAARPTDPEAYAAVDDLVLSAFPVGVAVDAVGFSAGAGVLLRLALREPDRFHRLALLGVGDNVFESGDSTPILSALRGQAGPEDVRGELFRRLAASAGNDPEALVAFMSREQPPLRPEDLAGLDLPVLVVLGDRDFIGHADRLMAALPSARLVMLPGVDHFATPADFAAIDAVIRFLTDD